MGKKRIVVDGYEFLLDKGIYEKYQDVMGDDDELETEIITMIIIESTASKSIQEALNKHSKEYLENIVTNYFLDELKSYGVL